MITLFLVLLLVSTNVAWAVLLVKLGYVPDFISRFFLRRLGLTCSQKNCDEVAEVDVSVKEDGKVQEFRVCQAHGKELARKVPFLPGATGSVSGTKDGGPFTAKFTPSKVFCEDGYDHSHDEPPYIPGHIHAHVQIPDLEEFNREHGVTDGPPDLGVMRPSPLDDISAAIEAAYQAKKPQIDEALNRPPSPRQR